ncbi:MAG: chemotaxis protein CheR [Burkholderiales bacterium]|nr:chemotaxis protein CheR [Burkholderiales bacterium]
MLDAKKHSQGAVANSHASLAFGTREFAYRHRDFERVCGLIYERAGIALNESKAEMVYSRLTKRLRALALDNFKSYLAVLDDPGHGEWEHFINALTTNQTDFFREAHHFPTLTAHALALAQRPLRLWSAASSTGEEPYSIAMTICEAFGKLDPPARIVATDLDTGVLAKAKEGIYATERVAGIAPERLKRFFLKGSGVHDGVVKVRSELRALVEFQQLNLRTDDWPLHGPFDAIFCRNVLIYFDKPTQYQVLKRLAERLTADGLLFAGHSESLLHAADLFQPCGQTVYRRVGNAADKLASVRHA